MRQESHEKALKAVVEWYLERPWEEIGCLSTKSLESFAELLHTTWQQAQASMVEQMRFHKTGGDYGDRHWPHSVQCRNPPQRRKKYVI